MWASDTDTALRGVYGLAGMVKTWNGVRQGKEGQGIIVLFYALTEHVRVGSWLNREWAHRLNHHDTMHFEIGWYMSYNVTCLFVHAAEQPQAGRHRHMPVWPALVLALVRPSVRPWTMDH